jgi:hypothetical protein
LSVDNNQSAGKGTAYEGVGQLLQTISVQSKAPHESLSETSFSPWRKGLTSRNLKYWEVAYDRRAASQVTRSGGEKGKDSP